MEFFCSFLILSLLTGWTMIFERERMLKGSQLIQVIIQGKHITEQTLLTPKGSQIKLKGKWRL